MAERELSPADRALLAKVLPMLAGLLRTGTRGPPGAWVLPTGLVWVELGRRVAAGELSQNEANRALMALHQVWAVRWQDRVVVPDSRVAEVELLVAGGHLSRHEADQFWAGVIEHELIHLAHPDQPGHWPGGEQAHAEDALKRLEPIVTARTRRDSALRATTRPADATTEQTPTVSELVGFTRVGRVRRALLRYLIPRDLDASVRRHQRFGTPLVRTVVMGTLGRLPRANGAWNYRLGRSRAPLEAVTRFALHGSVFNEACHSVAVIIEVPDLVGYAVDGQLGGVAPTAAALVVNLALVALQRYNRARTVRAANRILATGAGYRRDYHNWAGIDQRALHLYYTGRALPLPPFRAAGAELAQLLADSELGWVDRRRVRREITTAERRHWGTRDPETQAGHDIELELIRLTAAALRAGLELDVAQLAGLAARAVRWRQALNGFRTQTNPAGHRVKTAAIATLLARAPPELRDEVSQLWTTDPATTGGLRRPVGDSRDMSVVAAWADGPAMTVEERAGLVRDARLRFERASPPAGFAGQWEFLGELVTAAIQVLAGEPVQGRFAGITLAPISWFWLSTQARDAMAHPRTGLAPGGAWVAGADRVAVYVSPSDDASVAAIHEIVELLALAWGFTLDQAHDLAVWAERRVDDLGIQRAQWRTARTHTTASNIGLSRASSGASESEYGPGPEQWVTLAEVADLRLLARWHPRVRAELVADYQAEREQIIQRWRGEPQWRQLGLHYAGERQDLAIALLEASWPVESGRLIDDDAARRLYQDALTELQQIVTQELRHRRGVMARMLARRQFSAQLRLVGRDSPYWPGRRLEMELRHLWAQFERTGQFWPSEVALAEVAAYNAVWGHFTRGELKFLRPRLIEVLLARADDSVAELLRPATRTEQTSSPARLIDVVTPPTHQPLPNATPALPNATPALPNATPALPNATPALPGVADPFAAGPHSEPGVRALRGLLALLAPWMTPVEPDHPLLAGSHRPVWIVDDTAANWALNWLATHAGVNATVADHATTALRQMVTIRWQDPFWLADAAEVVLVTATRVNQADQLVRAGALTEAEARAAWTRVASQGQILTPASLEPPALERLATFTRGASALLGPRHSRRSTISPTHNRTSWTG